MVLLLLNWKAMIEVGSLPFGNPSISLYSQLPKFVKEFLYAYNFVPTTEYVRTSLPKIIDFCSPTIWSSILFIYFHLNESGS